jgi:DNA-binding transcriptional MerR regulator
MTIKEFACLCQCNPQTLRYYDHKDLLKPAQVDPWSGYRRYEKEQALTFVKIKNLQLAGFTIQEIKSLLDQEDSVVYDAFRQKIRELEDRLNTIKKLQQSYQSEMSQMNETVRHLREMISQSMEAYDPTQEFDLDPQSYHKIATNVSDYLEDILEGRRENDLELHDDDDEEFTPPDFLHDPNYTLVYERHGWTYVKEFLDELPLDPREDYAIYCQVTEDKSTSLAFVNTLLGVLIQRVGLEPPDPQRAYSCNVTTSQDGENHFWLLK